MIHPAFNRQLLKLGACKEARTWARQFKSAQVAWDACEKGAWMMWLLGRTIYCESWNDGREPLLACALDFALTVKHLWPEDKAEKINEAVKMLRKWIKGKATAEEAKVAQRELAAAAAYTYAANDAAYYSAAAAACAAYYSANDAACAAANAAACATANATCAAANAAYYSAAAANASAANAWAANNAACAAARAKIELKCARIVRKYFPHPPVYRIKKGT